MPRTKYVRKNLKKPGNQKASKFIKEECGDYDDKINSYMAKVDTDINKKHDEMKTFHQQILDQIESIAFEELLLVDPEKKHKRIGELRKEASISFSTSAINNTTSILKHMSKEINNTILRNFNAMSCSTAKKKKVTDEGYLTAGDSRRSQSSGRETRSKTRSKVTASTRKSRSASRPKPQKNVTISAPEKKTPEKRMIPPNSFGFVTPKMKPNIPLTVLRRPKQGEMAISMQGSPLLVSGVVTEECANVNIPLQDGRILSLQPSRTLRQSEIPDLDELTRQQLLTLRDNLNKVVSLSNNML